MSPTDIAKKHVISRYVRPARERGEKTIQVRVGNVVKELGWTNRTPSVFSTLSSRAFQREAGLQLIEKRGGPASGGPSTTVQFVYKLLAQTDDASETATRAQDGTSLEMLFGLCKETFKALGGGESFLRRERGWGPDAWERYETEQQGPGKAKAGE